MLRRVLVAAGAAAAVGVAAVTAPAPLAAGANVYQGAVLADHPIAYWPMDDSSSPLTDATGNGNDGVYDAGVSFNAPSVLPGFPSDPSVSFSGSESAHVPTRGGAPAGDVTHLSGSFSVEAWVSPAVPVAGDRGIFGSRAPADNSFDFKLEASGIVHGDIGNGGGWYNTSVDATNPAGDWAVGTDYHIVYVVDAASSSWSIYIDGALAATGSGGSAPLLSDASHVIHIGSVGGGEFFDGRIGQVAVYSRVLTAAEISSHWQLGSLGGGTITVTKRLRSNSLDPARFNLQIDGTVYAANVGNGGTTGAVTVSPGTHTVSETAGTNANLGNYTARIACSDGSARYGTSLSGITANPGDHVTCTITNTRKLYKVG